MSTATLKAFGELLDDMLSAYPVHRAEFVAARTAIEERYAELEARTLTPKEARELYDTGLPRAIREKLARISDRGSQ